MQLYSFGSDSYSIILDDVDCSTSNYLVILQCSFSTYIDYNCINGLDDDASVTCCEISNNLQHVLSMLYKYMLVQYLTIIAIIIIFPL